jgi:trk system potassium uptake protein TrkA
MAKKIAVIGMGYFGSHLALELAGKGAEVLAIDENLDALDEIKDHVALTVRLDTTEEKAIKSLGLDDFDAVVVGIGDNFEAALLTVARLQDLGIRRLIVRATTPTHEKILQHLGVKEVILPAVEAAERLGNSLMFEQVVESVAISKEYTIIEVDAPDHLIGQSIEEIDFARKYGVTLITVRRSVTMKGFLGVGRRVSEEILGVPQPHMTIERGDILILFGTKKALDGVMKER